MVDGSLITLTANWMTRRIWVVAQRRSQCRTPPPLTGLCHVTPVNRSSRQISQPHHLTPSQTQRTCLAWTLTPLLRPIPLSRALLRRRVWKVLLVTVIYWTTCSPLHPMLRLQLTQKTCWEKVQEKICSSPTRPANQHQRLIKVEETFYKSV